MSVDVTSSEASLVGLPGQGGGTSAPRRGVGIARRVGRAIRGDRFSLFALSVLVVIVTACVLAPWIAPYGPNVTDLSRTLEGPGVGHLLGTDAIGRDLLSRLLYGGRVSLVVALVPTAGSLLAGGVLGVIAGYFGHWQDFAISRIVDTLMAFPYILLAIAIGAVLGPGIGNAMIAIGIAFVPVVARLVRANVLSLVKSDYVRAARGFGASNTWIIFRHIVPNTAGVVTVFGTLQLGQMVLASAGLSFLGLGVQPPQADWGGMLSEGQEVIAIAPHVATFSGLALFVVVMAVNIIGETLRDALDPQRSTT